MDGPFVLGWLVAKQKPKKDALSTGSLTMRVKSTVGYVGAVAVTSTLLPEEVEMERTTASCRMI